MLPFGLNNGLHMHHKISKHFPLIMETIACQGSGFMNTIIKIPFQVCKILSTVGTLFGFDHSDQQTRIVMCSLITPESLIYKDI